MTIRNIANAARGRREELGMSQADVARQAGVSRKWLVEFEAAKPTAELHLVLRLLEVLGMTLTVDRVDTSSSGVIDLDELLGATESV